jgi:DNA repair exonuclease SbcCD ATPase subunit
MSYLGYEDMKIIGGPITVSDDDPVTKYRVESDGRTFWAYSSMEVFYDDERMYDALDEIDRLTAHLEASRRMYLDSELKVVEQIHRIAELEAEIEEIHHTGGASYTRLEAANKRIAELEYRAKEDFETIKRLISGNIRLKSKLQDEIERLTAALATANKNHEHFEREWYLRGDEIERLTARNAVLEAVMKAAGDYQQYQDDETFQALDDAIALALAAQEDLTQPSPLKTVDSFTSGSTAAQVKP